MELTKHDLTLIRDALLRNFTKEQLEASGWMDQAPSQQLWKGLAELDLQFFNRFYLGQHFDYALSTMHIDTIRQIEQSLTTPGRTHDVVVWPRGHGKTTTVTNGTPLWCALFQKRRFVVVISDSHSQAKQQLATIKDELENNPRILEDFGDLTGNRWAEDDITLKNRVKILALGAGMGLRGRKHLQTRPDLIICDDLENLDSVMSPTQRSQTYEWFFRTVTKAGWSDTKIFVVGNFLHFDCLLYRLTENPMFVSKVYKAVTHWAERQDLWEEWENLLTNLSDPDKGATARRFFEDNKVEMLKGAETAWPEAFPYYDLMVTRVTDGADTFATELQNEPVDPKRRMFKKWETFRMEYRSGDGVYICPMDGSPSVPLSACRIFAATDPAMSKTSQADYTGIVLIAKAPTNQMFVLVADIGRYNPDVTMQLQTKYALQYPVTRWHIESNAFQAMFATESGRVSMRGNAYLNIEAISTIKDKELRINSLQPDLENGYLLINENGQEELKKELREYPMGAHRDGLDALEMARTLARKWEPLENTELVQADAHQFNPSGTPLARVPLSSADPYAKWDQFADQTIREYKESQNIEVEDEPEVFVPMMYI